MANSERIPILAINTEHGWRGGENQVFLLVRDLDPRFLPIVACLPDSELGRRLAAIGIECISLGMRGLRLPAAALRLRRLVRARGIRLVHAHTSLAHGLGLLVCAGGGPPLVVTRRVDFAVSRGVLSRWKYGSGVSRFVAISHAIRNVLIRGGVVAEAIEVIRSGVDPQRIDRASAQDVRAEIGAPATATLVANVAALVAHKDHRTLLHAWQQVEREQPSAWLVIIGTGDLDAELAALGAHLGLTRVAFLGWRDDVAGILKRADLFVISSREEGLGTTIIDALLAGLPVVATRAGGIPEVVGADCGVLVPVGDAPALAAEISSLIGDPARRRALGATGRQRALVDFTHRAMVDGYQRLYADLIDHGVPEGTHVR